MRVFRISPGIVASVIVVLAVSAVAADVLTTTTGNTLSGEVLSYKRNGGPSGGGAFVIKVDGREQTVPVDEVESILVDSRRALSRSNSAPRSSKPKSESSDSEEGTYWLSATGKRHNSSCRYHGSSKGRACGPKEGSACKLCGG